MVTFSLTTTFTPPSSCSTHWTYEGSYYNSVSKGLLMQNVLAGSIDTDCFPTRFTNNGRAEGSQIYSPGACPVGYATALSQNGATTTAVCCLSGFAYYTTLTTINGYSKTAIFAGCVATLSSKSTTNVPARRDADGLNSLSAVTGPITMWGQPITVQYRASVDTEFVPMASSTSTFTSTASQSVSEIPSTASPTMSLASQASTTSVGLSIGAIAGIATGGVLGLVMLAALLWFLLRQRGKSDTASDPASAGWNGEETCANEKANENFKKQSGFAPHELHAELMRSELPA
ncbi:hypothetical protein EG327_006493 [Venturia inaequalis]|uniref:Uncharacterized protein n=1 Tax=Venturia inaequalis TaxID=5025 RepID=A0A8H3V4P0_VENIN|nr:hypothetical protein EG327_006493 [Venturia inaequalis]